MFRARKERGLCAYAEAAYHEAKEALGSAQIIESLGQLAWLSAILGSIAYRKPTHALISFRLAEGNGKPNSALG